MCISNILYLAKDADKRFLFSSSTTFRMVAKCTAIPSEKKKKIGTIKNF